MLPKVNIFMKAGFQLRLGQQVTMTPQLQQAIRLLQLSALELQAEIQQALESNFMLEVEDETDSENNQDFDLGIDNKEDDLIVSNPDGLEEGEEVTLVSNDIPTELEVDTEWEDIYSTTPFDLSKNEQDSKDLLVNQESAAQTLQDHLLWQVDLTPFSDLDRACAIAIIDAIDNDGYLRMELSDIVESLEGQVSLKEIETVLRRIQHFDPVGVGARDLRECLLLQLAESDPDTPWLKEAKVMIQEHLALLGTHDYTQLTKHMQLSIQELRKIENLIQSLNPRPGAQIEPLQTVYVTPDVFVKKVQGQWKVEINSENSPKLRVNSHYANLISQVDNRADNKCIKTHLQEARWFIKSLESRHETLLKVAKCIVDCQSGFLDYGEEAMRPLVLHDIATELDMHESTISRVTTQKYLHTPRGIFELKYFFSSHVGTKNGGECSSTAIRAIIKKLISAEDTAKPLSDNKIANLLSERGIKVARRTVAKYREAMVIPPSNERKRLA